jgi:hypothetical protein
MPLARYHRGDAAIGPSVSSTTLRRLWNESPAHAWAHDPNNPNRVKQDDSEAFILGRALHHLICGQINFADEFVVQPDFWEGAKWHGNRTECKKWTAARKREGKTILTGAQVEQIRGMAARLGEFPLMQAGILNGLIERSLFWQDKETGLWLKARPDAIPNHSGDYGDLKSTESVLYKRLQAALANYGYHQQAALVIEGAKTLGLEVASFTLIWVETKPPHCVRAQQLKDEDIARGIWQNRAGIRTFADCLASGNWPGPGDDRADAEYIELPDATRKLIDDRLKFELREAA